MPELPYRPWGCQRLPFSGCRERGAPVISRSPPGALSPAAPGRAERGWHRAGAAGEGSRGLPRPDGVCERRQVPAERCPARRAGAAPQPALPKAHAAYAASARTCPGHRPRPGQPAAPSAGAQRIREGVEHPEMGVINKAGVLRRCGITWEQSSAQGAAGMCHLLCTDPGPTRVPQHRAMSPPAPKRPSRGYLTSSQKQAPKWS